MEKYGSLLYERGKTLIYISLGKKKNTLIEINNKMKSALNQNLEVLVKY